MSLDPNTWTLKTQEAVNAAIEALSRYGKAQGRMLGSLTIAPNQWPTSAVIDWLSILKRVPDVPQRELYTVWHRAKAAGLAAPRPHDVPVLCAVPAHERAPEHRLRLPRRLAHR